MGKQFNIIINGGGLGGLGASIALARSGHKVIVLEGAPALSEVGAGIQIPPNSTRIIKSYGLEAAFLEKIVLPSNIYFRRYCTGDVIGPTPLHPKMTDQYGYPYWLIHRADYQQLLFDAAVREGVEVRLSSYAIEINEAATSVTLHTGETLTADLIVGADGIRSRTRAAILKSQNPEPVDSPNWAYRATVSRELMMSDSKIAHLMTDINSNCWIGPDRHIMAYPIRNGTMYNLVMSHPEKGSGNGLWNQPGDLNEMKEHYKDFDPVIRQVLTHVTSCLKWKLAKLPKLPTWVGMSGKVVLIGDAAHGMVPYLAQGAATSIEDGASLAECLDRAKSVNDIPNLLKAFEAIRKERCETISDAALANGDIWHMHDGPGQQERDRMMMEKAEGKQAAPSKEAVNPNKWSDPSFQPWLFGHDTAKEVSEYFDKVEEA